MDILKTGVRNVRNVSKYIFGKGSLSELAPIIQNMREQKRAPAAYFIDEFFQTNTAIKDGIGLLPEDSITFISTKEEPSTIFVDNVVKRLISNGHSHPAVIIGIGGGITMDIAKAVANLLTNGGQAADYQGWDLVKVPGIFKIAVPTISGTGAEATRTCVMTNKASGLKLGMNSDFTVYDQVIMDPELTKTVPRNQYFYTGMDAFIHSFESLSGNYRNMIGDSLSEKTIDLCKTVFLDGDMMESENRERLMIASYLGGCAIASGYVGLVHPFSAGLSVVLGTHHCIANCIVMNAMEEFYPEEFSMFQQMIKKQNIELPQNVCSELTDAEYDQLYEAVLIHEKPLTNALGVAFRNILTPHKVREIFEKM